MTQIPHTISRQDLAGLALRRYEGPVRVVRNAADLERAMRDIRAESVVGLDTETPPTFRRGQFHLPSLVQIATGRAAYLFQLRRMNFAAALGETLSSPSPVKAGIALSHDLAMLKRVFAFQERNVTDVGALARRHGVQHSGIRNLAGLFLGFRIAKGSRTSNWGRPELSPKQIVYAATDAWVCRELYLRFQQLGWIE
jgi:ribonuclease D